MTAVRGLYNVRRLCQVCEMRPRKKVIFYQNFFNHLCESCSVNSALEFNFGTDFTEKARPENLCISDIKDKKSFHINTFEHNKSFLCFPELKLKRQMIVLDLSTGHLSVLDDDTEIVLAESIDMMLGN